jgi:hypothetical protein
VAAAHDDDVCIHQLVHDRLDLLDLDFAPDRLAVFGCRFDREKAFRVAV